MEDLRRRVENAKMKLTAEMKVEFISIKYTPNSLMPVMIDWAVCAEGDSN